MKNILTKIRKNSERGQAIILIAFSIVGMIAIVGLMTDGGITLVEYARLKRGIDAASIAAAAQFRKNFVAGDIKKAGEEFLQFNQSTSEVTISICDPNHSLGTVDPPAVGARHDPTLCFDPPRKLVRITATRHVDFGFMKIIGLNGTNISATSIGEAASVDLVLAIDTSSSMANDTDTRSTYSNSADPTFPTSGSPGDDPEVCNAHMNDGPHATDPDLLRRCEPMGKVKDAAVDFVSQLFFPYDRVALVSSTGQQAGGASRDASLILHFNDNYDPVTDTETTEIQDEIRKLRVFQPSRCPLPLGDNLNVKTPCLQFGPDPDPADPSIPPPHYYVAQVCIPRLIGLLDPTDTTPPYDTILTDIAGFPIKDPTTCGPSNIGGMLYEAGNEYENGRQDAFWAVIVLFGGPANGSNPSSYPDGLCPKNTWVLPGGSGFCRDEDIMPVSYNPPTSVWSLAAANYANNVFDWSTYTINDFNSHRHHFTVNTSDPANPFNEYPADYNADDYARDGADYIASPSTGQGATIYSICMGDYCRAYPNINDPASGELLGRYMALNAGDSIFPPVTANHGDYFPANSPADLVGPHGVFAQIAENIFTRISQ